MPSLDVVVPCYNYARFLERSVRSALDQEGADVRVLIIDDCSSDDSALVGQRLASEDPRVEFRRHEKNQGHIATYNEGLLGWAKADFCLLLSADDSLAPGAFQRALKLFEKSEDVGLVFGMARITTRDDAFQFPAENDFTSAQIRPGEAFLKYCCESTINPVPTATAIVRTALQHRLGGYRKDLPHTGDLEMWMRFALNGSIGIVRSVQAEYRQHGANMSLSYYAQLVSDRREFALTCQDALKPILAANADARSWLVAMYAALLSYAQQNAAAAFDDRDTARYNAWSAFAREMATHLDNPKRSWRLTIRELLGYKMWRMLRSARNALKPRAAKPEHGSAGNSSPHGDIIGWWPA